MKLSRWIGVCLALMFSCSARAGNLILDEFVDPLIGTESKRADAANAAGMQPFVGVPFGMWQWTAMTQLSELGKVSYDDSCKHFLGFIGTLCRRS